MKIFINSSKLVAICIVTLSVFLNSCDDYLEADPSTGTLVADNIFLSDATANSAVTGIYAAIMGNTDELYMLNGGLGVMAGLSADEIHDFDQIYQDFEMNTIDFSGFGPDYYHWSGSYNTIYSCNAAIIGLTDNQVLTSSLRDNLLGEVHFLRALNYFYLTNLYGDVPLVLTTDYLENLDKPKSTISEIYELIIEDLDTAENLLSQEYRTADRARPNKSTVIALQARVALYLENYETSITKSSELINSTDYILSPLETVFKKSSTETIWQLASVVASRPNTLDAFFYNPLSANRPNYTVTDVLFNSFETDDNRKTNWISQFSYNNEVYNYPFKYTQTNQQPATEFNIMFRLAEQYLIRAEAYANLGSLNEAVEDLNEIRNRAGLNDYAGSLIQNNILDAIMHERQVELFSEYGHRWFDLKRTSRINEVLGATKPNWQESAALWPIPQKEIDANPNLTQNPGY